MPTRKQKRRQQKLQRHEYEEVYVDEEGNELAPEVAEELIGSTRATKNGKGGRPDRAQTRSRGGRVIEPPSWRRTGRRGLIFFPLMLITVMLLGKDLTLPQQVVQTIVLMGFFLPFSYFMDSMVWRSYQKRLARDQKP